MDSSAETRSEDYSGHGITNVEKCIALDRTIARHRTRHTPETLACTSGRVKKNAKSRSDRDPTARR